MCKISVFKDKSIISQEICTIPHTNNSSIEGVLLDIQIPIGCVGTEIILTVDEICEVLKVLDKG